ncbi:Transcriptional regulator of nonfermentable carbon utilization, partial [Ascosphaera acerosa]
YLHDAPNEVLIGVGVGVPVPLPVSVPSTSSATLTDGFRMPAIRAPASAQAQTQNRHGFAALDAGDGAVYPPSAQGYTRSQDSQTATPTTQSSSQAPSILLNDSPAFTTLPGSVNASSVTVTASGDGNGDTNGTLGALDTSYGSTPFDPSHPALFNFDLASMNFDNHYGAMEFGILAHMTGTGNGQHHGSIDSNAGTTTEGASDAAPRPDSTTSAAAALVGNRLPLTVMGVGNGSGSLAGVMTTATAPVPTSMHGDFTCNAAWEPQAPFGRSAMWPATTGSATAARRVADAANSLGEEAISDGVNEVPPYGLPKPRDIHAYVIGNCKTPSLDSDGPETDGDSYLEPGQDDADGRLGQVQVRSAQDQAVPQRGRKRKLGSLKSSSKSKPSPGSKDARKRRRRSPKALYTSVTKPYSYTNGFHRLTAYIHKRFSPSQTLQIAKALASIRPSLIATNKTLDVADLIFMEKCFQRTIWEYEDFISVVGTPTIICRRTGEVAAVGQEFCMLTGWKKEVLLGQQPNENVNIGSGGDDGGSGTTGGISGPMTAGGKPGAARKATTSGSRSHWSNSLAGNVMTNDQPRPVMLAELLDDESVIEFYDDFAKLAFGDSRGSIMTTCRLLKYQTMDASAAAPAAGRRPSGAAGPPPLHELDPDSRWARKGIAGQKSLSRLGSADGKVECSCCWTVKRDVFDIPMLIIMNVSLQTTAIMCRTSGNN